MIMLMVGMMQNVEDKYFWGISMAWYCDRCGTKKSSISCAKCNSKNTSAMEEKNIPNIINICGSCEYYLFPYQKHLYERLKIDSNYLKHPDYDFYKESRFHPKSREFDIEYEFLNSDTNLYWDEDYYDVIDFISCYEELQDKFYNEYEDDDYEEVIKSDTINLQFVEKANLIIQNSLHEKSTTAFYESLKEAVENSYETTFTTNIQNFVTRLGLIINDVVNIKFHGEKHYIEILDYLCHQIIDDDYIYQKLSMLNKQANAAKHTKRNIYVDINSNLTIFNSMIDKLIEVSGCNAFEICHVYKLNNIQEIECSCCGRINPEKYYRCKGCKKIVCIDCFNQEKRLCIECSQINDTSVID